MSSESVTNLMSVKRIQAKGVPTIWSLLYKVIFKSALATMMIEATSLDVFEELMAWRRLGDF